MINQSLDMDTYIKKRLTENTDDDERNFAREVILKGLLPALKAVESLYHLFVYNRVPWSTVNTGDLERFYELYTLDPEEAESIKDWKILYDEWEDRIDRDYISLWNVEKFYFRCMKFMMPSLDGKYYEHELDLEQYDTDSGYMVENNEDILSIRYEKNKIIMTLQKETFENWCAYRFGRKMDMDSYGYDHRILGNQKKESFADHLVARYGQGIHTRTEMIRIVEGLGVEDYIQLEDCRIKDKESEGSFPADMNWFIKEEVFPMEARRVLELTFVRRKDGCAEAYYAEDMLRYAVSQIQLFLDEYKCVGVFA